MGVDLAYIYVLKYLQRQIYLSSLIHKRCAVTQTAALGSDPTHGTEKNTGGRSAR